MHEHFGKTTDQMNNSKSALLYPPKSGITFLPNAKGCAFFRPPSRNYHLGKTQNGRSQEAARSSSRPLVDGQNGFLEPLRPSEA
jgi:hypothetical protein